MPDIGTLLKNEIRRMSKRALNPQIGSIKKDVAELKRVVANQKRQIHSLERDNSRLVADLNQRIAKLPVASTIEANRIRISPRIIATQRKRLGLTQSEFGKLLNVSGNTVLLWEHKKAHPRKKVRDAFAALRQLGRRDVRQRLAAMAAINGNGRTRERRAA